MDYNKLNKNLRIWFITFSLIFILVLVVTPKTNCQACRFAYGGEIYNGYRAFDYFEETCISYDVPWDEKEPFYVNLDNIDFAEDGELSWEKEDELTKEELDKISEIEKKYGLENITTEVAK